MLSIKEERISTALAHKEDIVSIIIVNYKEYDFLHKCLTSLKSTQYRNTEIVVVDNESDPYSLTRIEKDFENVKFLPLKENLNYAEGNNLGIANSRGDYIVILNNDTIVDNNWLDPLLEQAMINPDAFYQPRILFLDNPDIVNSYGNTVHVFGFAFPIGIGKKITEMETQSNKACEIFYCSGACLFASRKVMMDVGGFDSNYWTYYEDVNLGWRARLYGYHCYVVPNSTIYHRWGVSYGQKLSNTKFYLLERGRLSTVFRNFSLRSLLFVAPLLMTLDIIVILYLLLSPRKGLARAKIKASLDVARNWKSIYNDRIRIQRTRTAKDKEISEFFSSSIEHPYVQVSGSTRKILSFISDRLISVL